MVNLSNYRLIGLDSNIFIYYFEENPEFGQVSKKILDLLNASTVKGVTSILSIIEATSKRTLPAKIAKDFEEDLIGIPNLSILDIDRKIAPLAAGIRREYDFRLPDSIQLATALFAKAKGFITNDYGLKKFKEIKVILLSEIK